MIYTPIYQKLVYDIWLVVDKKITINAFNAGTVYLRTDYQIDKKIRNVRNAILRKVGEK